ncbi:MAG: preprotein translocase subunit SecY [Deltaproteobacteria bacterium]|nr:preprotein translocase subunit SecY [Deltaproteobacteria bacterium]
MAEPTQAFNPKKLGELQSRILFTVGVLLVYRLGTIVPTPGINPDAMRGYLELTFGTQGSIVTLFNLFSGGALESFSVFALGIMPYVTASIIMQLMGEIVPQIKENQREGEVGRQKNNQYTRYLSVALCAVQATVIASSLQGAVAPGGIPVVREPGILFVATAVLSLTTGSIFVMWMGEQVTRSGIGNGISLIIFAGIVTSIPGAAGGFIQQINQETINPIGAIMIGIIIVGSLVGIVFIEQAERRIPVQYPGRMMGRRQMQGVKSHLPLKLNPSNVIPPIFASSLLVFLPTVSGLTQDITVNPEGGAIERFWESVVVHVVRPMGEALNPSEWLYSVVFGVLIVAFAFFYTSIIFNPDEMAENIKRNGGFVPGIRPGSMTANFIRPIMNRLTLIGGVYLVIICAILPYALSRGTGVTFYFGGTSVLICVGVALDTFRHIADHLRNTKYDALLEGKALGKIKGRRRSAA